MERLAIYTAIDGKIHTRIIKYSGNTEIIYKIPHGFVKLNLKVIACDKTKSYTEIFIEDYREYLLRDEKLVKLAFEIYTGV